MFGRGEEFRHPPQLRSSGGFFGGVALHLKLFFTAYSFTDTLALRKNFKIPKIFYSEIVLKFQKFANDIAILAIFPELVVLPCNKI